MKYFSILRDSLREALDSKLLYFTFGLSLLLIFLLGSTSFRPVTMQEQVQWWADFFNWTYGMEAQGQPGSRPLRWELTSFQQLDDAPEPWKGRYRFTLRLDVPKDREQGAEKKADIMAGLMQYELWQMKVGNPTREKSPDGRDIRLTFTTHGSLITDVNDWPHEPALLFGAVPLPLFRSSLTYRVYWIENVLVNSIGGWVIVLLGVIITASFIPNMLRKGTVDLLLSKPVTRPGLLAFKYVGGLSFLFINAVVAIGGVWLVLGLRTGIWTWSFPVTILILTFFFAILYSISALFAILTRSTVVCILMTLVAWALLFGVSVAYDVLHPPEGPGPIVAFEGGKLRTARPERSPVENTTWVTAGVDVLHTVLPRTGDLGALTTRLISHELMSESERRQRGFERTHNINWLASFGVSLAFIAVMLGLASWRFVTKDY